MERAEVILVGSSRSQDVLSLRGQGKSGECAKQMNWGFGEPVVGQAGVESGGSGSLWWGQVPSLGVLGACSGARYRVCQAKAFAVFQVLHPKLCSAADCRTQ